MNKTTICCILAASMIIAATPMFAGTLAVGPPACEPSYTHFSTIQSAVTAAPVSGTTTILICPGIYPEQVQIIGKRITLKGVAYNGSNASVVVSPQGGMVSNATSNVLDDPGNVQAQILVQNTTATIEYLTTDASNSGAADPIGVFFQNASGNITHCYILNDITSATGDQDGYGIYVDSETTTTGPNPSNGQNSTVTISDNQVSNFQKNGIMARETGSPLTATVTVSGNTVVGNGPWSGAGQNSIEVIYGAVGTITSNTVGADIWAPDVFGDTGNAAAGILVGYGSEGVVITDNQVSNTQYGIAIEGCSGCGSGDNATVTGNTISATHLYDAIDVCANNATVESNKINGADESGIHLDDSCFGSESGSSVSGNTISGSCAGVLEGPGASGSGVGTNTYYNVGTQQMTGSDTCTPALVPVGGSGRNGSAHKMQRRLRP